MYADDIVIFSNTSDGIQKGLDVPSDNYQRWKFTVTTEIKIMKFERQEIYLESCILFFKEMLLKLLVSLYISELLSRQLELSIKLCLGKGLKQQSN